MKYKNYMIFLILALFTINFASAEVSLWSEVYINEGDQTVSRYGYFQFDDTSIRGVGRDKPIEMIIYYDAEDLPYDLSVGGYVGYVDWCNLTIRHDQNEYGGSFWSAIGFTGGEYLNTTTTTDSYYFANSTGNNGFLSYDLKDKDSLTVEFECHYTDASSVFVESIFFGDFSTFFGAYECDDCEEYSLEELSNAIARNEEIIIEQAEVWNKIQAIIDINYNIWIIMSWIVKIALLFTAVSLIFGGIYWLYLLFKSIEEEI